MKNLFLCLTLLTACVKDEPTRGPGPADVAKHIKETFYTENMAVDCLYIGANRFTCTAANGNKFACNTSLGIGCIPGDFK